MADLLTELQATFPQGATQGTFSPDTLQDGAYQILVAKLNALGPWSLTSAQGWRVVEGQIVLDGVLVSPVLGVSGTPIWIRFSAGPSQPADDWAMLIDIGLPAGWRFGDSFALLQTPLYAGLPLSETAGQGSALIIASDDGDDPRRLVGGAPSSVEPGLNFFGYLALNGSALGQIAWLLQAGTSGPVRGPIGYDVRPDVANPGLVEMDLPITTAKVSGLFPSAPDLEITLNLYGGLNSLLNLYESGVRLAAGLTFTDIDLVDADLVLSALFSDPNGGVLEFQITGQALAFPSAATLARYFGGDNDIVAALPDQFSNQHLVQIDGVLFGVGLASKKIEFAYLSVTALASLADEDAMWWIWPDVIGLSDVNFLFSIFDPFGTSTKAFDFSSRWNVASVPIVVRAQLPGQVLSGGLDKALPAPLVKGLVDHVVGFDSGLPTDLRIARLDLVVDVGQHVYSLDIEVDGEWSFDFGDDNTFTFERLTLSLAYSDPPEIPEAQKEATLGAIFAIDDNEFTISFDITPVNTTFKGTWEGGAEGLNYQDIAIALGLYGLPNLPESLDLTLRDIEFEFESAGPSFAFDMFTTSDNGAVMVAGKNEAGDWGFIFGAEIKPGLDLDLASIPVVGDLLPSSTQLSIDEIRFVGATEALPLFTPTPKMTAILGDVISSGLALSIDLSVGPDLHETFTVRFGGSDDGTAQDTPPGEPPGLPRPAAFARRLADAPTTAAPAMQATWIDVQRSFGPLSFHRVGFMITPDNALAILLDAGVSQSGLTIDLTGLRMAMAIQEPYTPVFSLAGLTIDYTSSSFKLGGGLKMQSDVLDPVYSGVLTASLGAFSATLLGSYTTVDNSPSLFAFLYVNQPLGGPAFFFVTGVAGGFGYNRNLILPTIDNVSTYPLVRGALGTLDEADTLQQLETHITPKANQNWVAMGVRFTSFEMVRSFALVTVSFGATEEIALIGQSTISLPVPAAGDHSDPVAEADLQILVDINLSQGYVAASAQLSPASFVLDRAAQLTGGFACYTWFAPSPHAGDFVITLGGYNPYFTPPSHYPNPPRLGLNWKASSDLTIKGELYFALTPSAVMAGGSLSCVWEDGDLKAWFDAHADFLMRYKPFSYLIMVGINVGFSVTIDLWFTSKTITMDVGVDLTLYGDPFGGEARIDVYVVSFTIPFGADQGDPPLVDWAGFKQSFLPPVLSKSDRRFALARWSPLLAPPALPTTATDSLITLSASRGLLRTVVQEQVATWIVDPAALSLVLGTQIPSKSATFSPTMIVPTAPLSQDFGIGPMGIAPDALKVDLAVVIKRDGAIDTDTWQAQWVLSAAPKALWANTSASLQVDSLVPDVLTGVVFTPAPAKGGVTRPVALGELMADKPLLRDWSWSPLVSPSAVPADQGGAMTMLKNTLADPAVGLARRGVLDALARQNANVSSAVELGRFAQQAQDILTAAPQLAALGQTPAGSNSATERQA